MTPQVESPDHALSIRRGCAIALLVSAPFCLLFLGRVDLIRMEPILGLAAEDMLHTHQWFVPHLYGEVYAFKPSLAYWMVAVSESLLGRSEFTVRLPTALCGIALVLLICHCTARLTNAWSGLAAGLMALTSYLFWEQARSAGFDMPLALGVGCALSLSCANLAGGRGRLGTWVLAYAGLLFGLLAKGLPAPTFYFPALLVAGLLTGRLRVLFGWRHLVGLAVFLAGGGLYAWLVWRAEGSELFRQPLGEILFRSGWTPLALLVRPLVIAGVFMPASALAVVAILARPGPPESPAHRFRVGMIAILATDLLICMAAPAERTRYYLPLITPIAILAGIAADALAAGWFPFSAQQPRDVPRHRVAKMRRGILAFLLVVGLVNWLILIGIVEPHRAADKSLRAVADAFAPHIPAGTTVYIDTSDAHTSLAWYLGHEVRRWRMLSSDTPPQPGPTCFILTRNRDRRVIPPKRWTWTSLASRQGPTGSTVYELGLVSLATSRPASTTHP